MDTYLQNQMAILQVVHQMKEIPELPSERPKDSNPLTKVEFPDEGGVLTYMAGQDYPYRGFPFAEMVDKIDILKKVSRAFLSGTYHALKGRNKLWFLTLIPALWASKVLVRAGIYVFYRTIERFRIKKEMYSQTMRELYRAFSLEDDELRNQVRDVICMTLEFDNAYRFRFQDIIAELDQDAVRKDTPKELLRLFTIMQSREKGQDINDTWKLLKLFVSFYLKFDKKLCHILSDTLGNIDIQKVKLSIEDRSYCTRRKDYTFAFMKNPTDEDKILIEKGYRAERIEKAQAEVRKESDRVHQELFAKHREELKIEPEVVQKVDQEIQALQAEINKQANDTFFQERSKIEQKYLTEEQRQIAERHLEEIKALDDKYNKELEHVSI